MKHTPTPWTEPRIYTDSYNVPCRIAIFAPNSHGEICSLTVHGKDYRAGKTSILFPVPAIHMIREALINELVEALEEIACPNTPLTGEDAYRFSAIAEQALAKATA